MRSRVGVDRQRAERRDLHLTRRQVEPHVPFAQEAGRSAGGKRSALVQCDHGGRCRTSWPPGGKAGDRGLETRRRRYGSSTSVAVWWRTWAVEILEIVSETIPGRHMVKLDARTGMRGAGFAKFIGRFAEGGSLARRGPRASGCTGRGAGPHP